MRPVFWLFKYLTLKFLLRTLLTQWTAASWLARSSSNMFPSQGLCSWVISINHECPSPTFCTTYSLTSLKSGIKFYLIIKRVPDPHISKITDTSIARSWSYTVFLQVMCHHLPLLIQVTHTEGQRKYLNGLFNQRTYLPWHLGILKCCAAQILKLETLGWGYWASQIDGSTGKVFGTEDTNGLTTRSQPSL